MRKAWIFWPLYTAVMGFTLGASFFFGMYGRNVTESGAPTQHQRESANETTRPQKDEADEALAFYTLWLMTFTGILAFATIGLGGATLLLYVTGEKQFKFAIRSGIRQSRRMQESIEAAQKSADAAMLAVGAERAWMMHEGLPIIVIKDTSTKSKIIGLQATPIWKNMGRSPALGTNIAVNTAVIPMQLRAPPEFHRNWQSSQAKPPLGPNQLMSGAPDIMEEPQASAILQGKAAWIVYSAIRYRDMFNPGIERFSEVCLRVTRNGDINTPKGIAPNWEIMAFGLQNTAT
jgi:hypothetical protein